MVNNGLRAPPSSQQQPQQQPSQQPQPSSQSNAQLTNGGSNGLLGSSSQAGGSGGSSGGGLLGTDASQYYTSAADPSMGNDPQTGMGGPASMSGSLSATSPVSPHLQQNGYVSASNGQSAQAGGPAGGQAQPSQSAAQGG